MTTPEDPEVIKARLKAYYDRANQFITTREDTVQPEEVLGEHGHGGQQGHGHGHK